MHILFSANSTWNIWNFRSAIVRCLLAKGHRITILAPPDGAVASLQEMGCRVLPLQMNNSGLNPLEDMALFFRLREIFRNEKPDVVLSFTIKNNVYGALAAKAAGVPLIPNVTGLGTVFLKGRLMEALAVGLYRRAFRSLPAVFFQNPEDEKLFADLGIVRRKQSRLVPGSGIDLAHFRSRGSLPSDDRTVFLMIARLIRDKGVIEYIEAAREIRASHPGVRFQILGTAAADNRTSIGPGQLRSWVDGGIVEYLGAVPDVRPFIQSASCVVLPSYREGLPRTLIEAASMERPVIATDVPGCRSIVRHGRNGLLCKAKDSSSLAQAMRDFIGLTAEQRITMGRAGRAIAEQEYDEAFVIGAYLDAIARFEQAA